MPEIIEDDRIASLFTQFRAEAGTEILPPGTLAAQQTVRRRRATRLVGTAALASWDWWARPWDSSNMSGGRVRVEPASSHSFGPTLAPDELDRLGVEALAQLGYRPTNDRTRPELQLVRPGIIFGGVRTEASAFTYGLGTVEEPFPQATTPSWRSAWAEARSPWDGAYRAGHRERRRGLRNWRPRTGQVRRVHCARSRHYQRHRDTRRRGDRPGRHRRGCHGSADRHGAQRSGRARSGARIRRPRQFWPRHR